MKLSEVLTGTVALLTALAVARSEASPKTALLPISSVVTVASPSTDADAHAAADAEAAGPVAAGRLTTASSVIAAPPPTFLHGRARMIHAPTPCDVPAFGPGGPGAPYFVADGVPHAGEPFRVEWTTKPTCPADPPAWPALLLVSFERIPASPLDVMGAPGCHLMVEPEFIMVPHAGSILTQSGGRVRLDWTPHRSVIGQDFYSQLLVMVPGVNAGGILVSPLLHAVVGS